MSVIYDEQGNFKDLSDEGKQVKEIENNIDRELMIKRLPEKVQKIARLIYEGYNYKEIAEKLGLTETNVQTIVWRHRLNV